MENKTNFAETVMLIDAVLLDTLARGFKKHFKQIVHRPLPKLDIAQLIVNLAIDAALPEGDKEIQVILVYDQTVPWFRHCVPSSFKKNLDGTAFQDRLGEFRFACLSPEGITTREDLYFDLLQIIGKSPDVKQIIAVPYEFENRPVIHAEMKKVKGKEVILFGASMPAKKTSYTCLMLAYPIIQALGIRGEEL